MSLYDLQIRARLNDKYFTKEILRPSMRQLLAALDYLHRDAHVIHTGRPINLLQSTMPR
jgi:serine/threonine-protein kinase SRPK3